MAELPVKNEEISEENEEISEESEETSNESDDSSEKSEDSQEKNKELSEHSKEMVRQMLVKTMRFKDNIGKYVNVKTVDSKEHHGLLKCIDPMSGNMFLITFDEDFSRIIDHTLIFDSACIDMEVHREVDEETIEKLKNLVISVDLNDRKNQLLELIKTNRLPVEEREDKCLVVCENVVIAPPYNSDNCTSPNHRTLSNMQKIIEELPVYR